MKKVIFLMLCAILLTACHATPEPVETTEAPTEHMQLGNPWKNYVSMEEAEAASGLDFPLPDTVAGSYAAESYRVLNGELMEVIYRDASFEVIVRMQAGEDLDLSGVYGEFENSITNEFETYVITTKQTETGVLQLISKDGYSYSFYAPNHYWGDSNADFLAFLSK